MKIDHYQVLLIPPDLRHDECVIQVADSLDHLNMVAQAVFDGIASRVSQYKSRLQDVQARANLAKAKIDTIRGSSKATKVFSSYKYPSKEHTPGRALDSRKVVLRRSQLPSKSQHPAPDDRMLKEKLQFFNVRPPAGAALHTREEGLGRLPDCTDSVGSLLLFNTSESPYSKYVMRDPLGTASRTAQQRGGGDAPDHLSAAPASMSGADRRGVPHETFLYTPGMGQVPQMDAPAALPHLPGVADDLSYSEDLGPPIAPSWLPELPEVPAENPIDCTLPPEEPVEFPAEVSPAQCPVVQEKEPPLEEQQLTAAQSNMLDTRDAQLESGRAQQQQEVVQSDCGGRASLLESIRQAGGKPALRSVRRDQHRKEAPAPGGDLMSDLRNKLHLRRKGISGDTEGSKHAPPAQVTSPLDRVLEMIPAPQPRDSEDASTTDDTEWNDSD